ncbi:3D-(3,5/4)-trihydroxycyclohexane-1,2-dione acylhydrolase (decyclizing) [Asticcacaulis sp. DXS10W]|uniref:3D-(3,5/4)-trihydroxycyclohexane-1,2-dione acylhydrolase (Decyclizing) n=1 Tax=Asticcacaulis currens TaxID=2984210 RepID=A0ABT5IE33_9CAUL|nr:3D-(3,5/4)-trihydroxycyclohexane-1,2-dione acylhydrolase (decyclizing) [Asticcacaulis currens]MDC7694457.1 3D-(3,5/4)-trihydroxycyclohexane-1,2-dione acylhydrolase (decyclizing) [Asticcacaulis currens]
MTLIRLTMAQALTRWMAVQMVDSEDGPVPFFAGVWAIFGHGNVAGLGEALYAVRDRLPTYRAHNEQGMAHAAIAYAKQMARRRAFACTTSIGPGATNMVTAAAVAHVNRLPVLFLPGDVYASRRPDPVLQQIEAFGDATVSANDCFRPVSRYFDRITRPEQILKALPAAMAVLTDSANCGPVTLALCQDVQAEAFDYPAKFFEPRLWPLRRAPADAHDLVTLQQALTEAKRPLVITGGGVRYSQAESALSAFCLSHGIPFCETQAGKGALPHDHPLNLGAIGVTGTDAANQAAREADLIIAVGTRLQDFTTGSAALFPQARIASINTAAFDAHKFDALPVIGDAKTVLSQITSDYHAPPDWAERLSAARTVWEARADAVMAAQGTPTEAQVLGALMRCAPENAVVVAAAGGLPGDMHKLWRTRQSGGYHMEYGYSCMGYEVAGGLGVAMAAPEREVYVLVGDGSYMMMNSELATAVMMGVRLTVILIDNRGFGCIHRLQKATGGAPFNNRLEDSHHETLPDIDFVAHARAMGAHAVHAATIDALETAIDAARTRGGVNLILIETEATQGLGEGGAWWDVAVPEVSDSAAVRAARSVYDQKLKTLRDPS